MLATSQSHEEFLRRPEILTHRALFKISRTKTKGPKREFYNIGPESLPYMLKLQDIAMHGPHMKTTLTRQSRQSRANLGLDLLYLSGGQARLVEI